jgi:ribosomal protein L17
MLENNLSREEIAAGQKRAKELQQEIEAKIAAKKAGN